MNLLKLQSLRLLICAGLILAMLAACSPSTNGQQNAQQPTVTQTATVTPTVVWFPSTPTLAVQSTPTAAPDQVLKPGVGALLFKDDFQTADHWERVVSTQGNIIPGDGKLNLSVRSNRGELVALRKDTVLDNYYAEVTVQVNLCQGEDVLGMVFRTNGQNSYYRYLVDCNGRETAQVVIGGAPTPLYDWAPSGELVTGLVKPFTLGVWASKDMLRFFINDQLQFEVQRGTYLSGGIGFYVRSAGNPILSVAFDDLSVYDVSPTASQTITPALVTPSATPAK
jgi:hypothetical protein